MPQLDILAYTSEVLWLILIFSALYFLVLRLGLPKLYKVLRYRQDLVINFNKGVRSIEEEYFLISEVYIEVIKQGLEDINHLNSSLMRVIDLSFEEKLTNSDKLGSFSKNIYIMDKVGTIKNFSIGEHSFNNSFLSEKLTSKL